MASAPAVGGDHERGSVRFAACGDATRPPSITGAVAVTSSRTSAPGRPHGAGSPRPSPRARPSAARQLPRLRKLETDGVPGVGQQARGHRHAPARTRPSSSPMRPSTAQPSGERNSPHTCRAGSGRARARSRGRPAPRRTTPAPHRPDRRLRRGGRRGSCRHRQHQAVRPRLDHRRARSARIDGDPMQLGFREAATRTAARRGRTSDPGASSAPDGDEDPGQQMALEIVDDHARLAIRRNSRINVTASACWKWCRNIEASTRSNGPVANPVAKASARTMSMSGFPAVSRRACAAVTGSRSMPTIARRFPRSRAAAAAPPGRRRRRFPRPGCAAFRRRDTRPGRARSRRAAREPPRNR